jgi:N-acetylneuraminate lyase
MNPLLAPRNRILPALVTPLTDDGELDVPSLEHLIDHLYSSGVGGLYVTGSTGEGVYLDPEVRQEVVEIAVSLSKGHGQTVVHVGSVAASQAFDMARHAAQAGADAVSSIPPFVGGYGWPEVLGYYKRLAAASPIPVVGYYIPSLTGQSFSADQMLELMAIPNVVGFKCTDTNVYLEQRFLARMSPNQILYHGADELLAFGLAMGAHGGIGTTYNFMPKLILEIAQACAEGRLADAVSLQKKVNEIIDILLSTHGLAGTKQILVWQGHIASPTCAAPRGNLSAEQQASLRKKLMSTPLADTLVK